MFFVYQYRLYVACRDTRPQLVGQPPAGKKGLFVFSAIWGALGIIILLMLIMLLLVIGRTKIMGRDSKREADLHQIQSGLELYYGKNNSYPVLSSFAPLEGILVAAHLDIGYVPNDPTQGRTYYYTTDEEGKNYILGAAMEDSSNSLLSGDIDGSVLGISCNDPVYCVSNATPEQLKQLNIASSTFDASSLALSNVEGWKTYRNEQYGFEVKYPGDWKIQLEGVDSSQIFLIALDQTQIYITTTGLELMRVLTTPSSHEINSGVFAEKIALIETNIYEGSSHFSYKITFINPQPSWDKRGWIEASGDLKDKALVDQILSTFRFIDKNQ